MTDEHRPAIPLALEDVLRGLSELGVVLGEPGKAALPVIQTKLTEAMAARDRGDPVAVTEAIAAAMEQLVALAGRLDPGEAAMMKAVAERFRIALLRGNVPEAKQDMDVMFRRSGARERKQS
jgi:hypothetical protein